jgi:hypothetical protein
MTVRPCLGWVLAVVVGVVFGPPPALAEERPKPAQAPDLSGLWRLNKELSGDQRPKTGASSEDKGGREVSDSQPGNDRGQEGSGDPAETLTITQTGPEIVVQYPNGQARSLYPNGKTYKTDDGAAQIKSLWKDGKLVVEKKSVGGWKLVETWQLTPDRGRLLVDQRLEGGKRPKLSLKRVYDRVQRDN